MEPIILPRISNQKPLVSVISKTYNHEPYIRDCLEGFVMQQTSFPVEFIVHDDASTDHTADVIREYYEKRPDLFQMVLQRENQHSRKKPTGPILYKMAQGKYIAICEGDDYWTDPLKLQMQFDFMESHPDYSMCGTMKRVKYQESGRISNRKNHIIRTIDINQILLANPFSTCTTFLKKDHVLDWMSISYGIDRKKWKMGDYPLFIYCLTKGNGYILPRITATYRVLKASASHGDYNKTMRFTDGAVHVRLQLIKTLGISYSTDQIIKTWAFNRVKQSLKWLKFDNKKELKFYWRIYWRKGKSKKPLVFIMMFFCAYMLTFIKSGLAFLKSDLPK